MALPTVSSATELLGYEGIAAKEYVACWRLLVTPASAIPAPKHRGTRPASDPFNSALNFVYALLRVAVTGALESVGLDPYVGYLHSVRPSKPALALDLMEEFRALLVDRLVITAFNRRQLTGNHFHSPIPNVAELTDAGRRAIFELWSESRRREWPHPILKELVPAVVLPSIQATFLARHLRGDLAHYQPWTPF